MFEELERKHVLAFTDKICAELTCDSFKNHSPPSLSPFALPPSFRISPPRATPTRASQIGGLPALPSFPPTVSSGITRVAHGTSVVNLPSYPKVLYLLLIPEFCYPSASESPFWPLLSVRRSDSLEWAYSVSDSLLRSRLKA